MVVFAAIFITRHRLSQIHSHVWYLADGVDGDGAHDAHNQRSHQPGITIDRLHYGQHQRWRLEQRACLQRDGRDGYNRGLGKRYARL